MLIDPLLCSSLFDFFLTSVLFSSFSCRRNRVAPANAQLPYADLAPTHTLPMQNNFPRVKGQGRVRPYSADHYHSSRAHTQPVAHLQPTLQHQGQWGYPVQLGAKPMTFPQGQPTYPSPSDQLQSHSDTNIHTYSHHDNSNHGNLGHFYASGFKPPDYNHAVPRSQGHRSEVKAQSHIAAVRSQVLPNGKVPHSSARR